VAGLANTRQNSIAENDFSTNNSNSACHWPLFANEGMESYLGFMFLTTLNLNATNKLEAKLEAKLAASKTKFAKRVVCLKAM
jgi:hypothetical protein